ncbi:MAG: hypothetical protein IPJ19_14000 [Planctomycetes bacterium]|nr:hypothetical protein [Planctomycetota bacterium]
MDETSLLLYLKPELVSPLYKEAPIVTGATLAQAFDATKPASWPGYLGSPRQSSAALGETIWKSFAAAALEVSLKILDGVDPATFPRTSATPRSKRSSAPGSRSRRSRARSRTVTGGGVVEIRQRGSDSRTVLRASTNTRKDPA